MLGLQPDLWRDVAAGIELVSGDFVKHVLCSSSEPFTCDSLPGSARSQNYSRRSFQSLDKQSYDTTPHLSSAPSTQNPRNFDLDFDGRQ